MGVKTAQKEANKFLLQLGWRLDWSNHILRGKRRKLSRLMARTATTQTQYDASKLKKALTFEFKSMDESIKSVGSYFLQDVKNK